MVPPRSPLLVYLDSSDFSVLSDPRGVSPPLEAVRKQLEKWVDFGWVRCVFSTAHLCEMTPLNETSAAAAVARTDLLVRLCKRHCLISFDRLVRAELSKLQSGAHSRIAALSTAGEWYPDCEGVVPPMNWADLRTQVSAMARDRGYDRERRRRLDRLLFKGGRPTQVARQLILTNDGPLHEFMSQYPMRDDCARTLYSYLMGTATREAAEQAYFESVRDPGWMMRWLARGGENTVKFAEILRKPGREFAEAVRWGAQRMASLRSSDPDDPLLLVLRKPDWARLQNEQLVAFTRQLCPLLAKLDVADIDARCAGLSTAYRTAHWALRDSLIEKPRTPKGSDLPDCTHAMYAPYVDFFRADGYMSVHVASVTKHHGTTVVSNLLGLPEAIEARLNLGS